MSIHPVILCGGSGTRLWPLSRKSYPKQFAPLIGRESLFQASLRRLQGEGFAVPLVLTHADFRFVAQEQMQAMGLSDGRLIIEPEGRNTGPAVLVAALALADTPDALMLVAPSDHLIGNPVGFRRAVAAGEVASRAGRLVTFGVVPDRAETGYGYLELAETLDNANPEAHELLRFVEKPDAERAGAMLDSGRYLWNSGIFLFRVGDILDAFETHAPELMGPCKAALDTGAEDLGFFRLGADSYCGIRGVSIDYAVMEHAANLSVVPLEGGWTDLGSWDAVWRTSPQDGAGVATSGAVTAIGCERSLLRSDDETLHLVGLGLKNVVAVAMRDAVLVADMDAGQKVKDAVGALTAARVAQAEDFPRFHRPWGWYETLSLGTRFQVKRIMVKPGGILSLQSHVHRAEHWVVVEGSARVTIGEEEQLISENQSVYIPLGTVHRLENPGKLDLHLIEVQTGAYLGEDDITRYEDIYARV